MSARRGIIYLTALDVQRMHQELIEEFGAPSILCDFGALDCAVTRPKTLAYYEEADIFTQAAALVAGIALARAFEDGNKRLAYVAGETFLLVNGVELSADSIAYADEVLALVNRAGSLDEAQRRLANWLRGHGHKASASRYESDVGETCSG